MPVLSYNYTSSINYIVSIQESFVSSQVMPGLVKYIDMVELFTAKAFAIHLIPVTFKMG